jgi:hypothetical protein
MREAGQTDLGPDEDHHEGLREFPMTQAPVMPQRAVPPYMDENNAYVNLDLDHWVPLIKRMKLHRFINRFTTREEVLSVLVHALPAEMMYDGEDDLFVEINTNSTGQQGIALGMFEGTPYWDLVAAVCLKVMATGLFTEHITRSFEISLESLEEERHTCKLSGEGPDLKVEQEDWLQPGFLQKVERTLYRRTSTIGANLKRLSGKLLSPEEKALFTALEERLSHAPSWKELAEMHIYDDGDYYSDGFEHPIVWGRNDNYLTECTDQTINEAMGNCSILAYMRVLKVVGGQVRTSSTKDIHQERHQLRLFTITCLQQIEERLNRTRPRGQMKYSCVWNLK